MFESFLMLYRHHEQHKSSGSSAIITGKPVSSINKRSILRNNAPPPVNTIPRSAISAANSGGACSNAARTAPKMPEKVLAMLQNFIAVDGKAAWNAFSQITTTNFHLQHLIGRISRPISCLIRSAVDSPIKMP